MEFKYYELSEVAEVIDSLHKTPQYSDKGYPMVRVSDMYNGYFNLPNNVKRVTEETYQEFSKKHKPTKGDILMSRVGTYGLVNYNISNQQFCLGQNTVVITNYDLSKIDNKFLYYYLLSNQTQDQIERLVTGSTQKTLSLKSIRSIKIPIISLIEQKSIANLLSSFDDKIENNNSIIANLEEQAQTIFKSWFLDSELFQDEDFENKKLGDLFQFIKGKKPKATSDSYEEAYVPYLVKKYIDGNEATFASIDDGILIDDLDVFMLMDGANSGNIYYGYHGILGSTFSLLKNDNEMVNEYIYWYLLINQDSVKNQNTGSAIPHANKGYINNLEVILPIDMETNRVLKILRDIRLYTINLRRESNKLTATRDTLLPKLMSGEIRVEETIEVEEM